MPRKAVPPMFVLSYLVAGVLLHFFVPEPVPLPRWVRPASLAPIGLGVALFVGSVRLFLRAGTPLEPQARSSTLVVGGPYRFTRNPIYLGMTLTMVGVALALRSAWTLLAAPAFMATVGILYVPYEEAKLEKRFGRSYLNYRRRVRRWL